MKKQFTALIAMIAMFAVLAFSMPPPGKAEGVQKTQIEQTIFGVQTPAAEVAVVDTGRFEAVQVANLTESALKNATDSKTLPTNTLIRELSQSPLDNFGKEKNLKITYTSPPFDLTGRNA